jgi:hypothetical protein
MFDKHNPALSRLGSSRDHSLKGVDTGVEPDKEEDGDDGPHGALEAMHENEPGSKHVVVSHDGYGMTSHGIDEGGEHSGPHDHANLEELKSHLGKFFDEEEHEDGHDGEEDEEDSGNLY